MAGEKTTPEKAELIPVNINEELVMQSVKRLIKDLGACGCEVCFANACAIALNELRPKYVTTRRGALLTEVTSSSVANQADITVEATKAVLKVMKNPRH